MTKLFCVSIRWVKTPVNPQAIDTALAPFGDWIRFHGWTWLIASDWNAITISEALRKVLSTEDNILVIRSDPADYSGWAQTWVWNWINTKVPNAEPPRGLENPFFPRM